MKEDEPTLNNLPDLPSDILQFMTKGLNNKDLFALASVSKKLYDFIQEIYIHSLHGNTLGLIRFINTELSMMDNGIKNYQKSQHFSFFGKQQRNNIQEDWAIRLIRIPSFILISIYFISKVYRVFKADQFKNPLFDMPSMLKFIFSIICIVAIICYIKNFNFNLRDANIDQKTIITLNKLKESYPLLNLLEFEYDLRNTHNDINKFFEDIINNVEKTIHALSQFNNNYIKGTRIKQINLPQVSKTDKSIREFLTFFIKQWNDKETKPHEYKRINFKY